MTIETALYPDQLNASWPLQSDIVREGAGHLRLLKAVLKTTFPNVTGSVSASHVELSRVSGLASPVQTQLDALATGKGSVSGQTWTGTHVFPSTTTVGPLTPTIQTWLSGVTSDVQIQIDAKSTKTGDTYSGAHNFTGATVTVPTATAGDATNAAASTAFVSATAFNSALPGQTGNAEKFTHTDGSAADWQFPVLLPVSVAVNTAMVPGRKYIATVAGITLTFPASMTARDPIEVMNASSGDISVDFNGHTLKGDAQAGPMRIPRRRGFGLTYSGSTLA